MFRQLKVFCLVLFGMPYITFAAVTINEVAWMGNTESANDEWIELHNSGSGTVSVEGWTLGDGQALQITLAGSMGAGKYAVLERTDDSSAPGGAFLIYTGALSNTGAILTLKDVSGAVIDRVAGGSNWELIGGDNTTKETAQHTSSGWITAAPTPGSANASVGSVRTDESISQTSSSGGKSDSSAVRHEATTTFVPSTAQLGLQVATPKNVFVGQPITLKALPEAIGKTIMNSLAYEWNFGDMTTASGKAVMHTYQYPGEYLLSLRAHYARHDETLEIPITVLPMRFSITQSVGGDVQINNDSPYIVDVSGYTVRGLRDVTFPPRSYIPQGGTVTIPLEKIGQLKFGQAQLVDQQQTLLAALGPPVEAESAPVLASYHTPDMNMVTYDEPAPATFAFTKAVAPIPQINPVIESNAGEEELVITSSTLQAAVAQTSTTLPKDTWPLLGLLGIIALGIMGTYRGTQKS